MDCYVQFIQGVLTSFISVHALKLTEDLKPASPDSCIDEHLASSWTRVILRLKKKVTHVWVGAFENDPILETVISRTFLNIVETFQHSAAYIFLCHDMEVQGIMDPDPDPDQTVELLSEILELVKYLSASRMAEFEYWYRQHLSERILHTTTISSLNLEQMMIRRLRVEMGDEFARDSQSRDGNLREKPELSLAILASSFWPLTLTGLFQGEPEVPTSEAWAPELEAMQRNFSTFYSTTTPRLKWSRVLGTVQLICNFPG